VLRYIGRLKYRVMRLSGYVTLLNTAILIAGFGFKWWYSLAFIGIALAYLFEKKHGIPGEMDVAWKNSAEWQQYKREFSQFRKEMLR
jgi:hypothetical protein